MVFPICFLILLFKGFFDFFTTILFFLGCHLFVFIFISLPLIVLYLNYKKYNRNWAVKIDLPNQKIQIVDSIKNEELQVKFEEIKKIYKVVSYNKSAIHFGYMDFFYYELVLKSNERLIITCLVNEDLDKYIHQDKFKLVSKFSPYISKYV